MTQLPATHAPKSHTTPNPNPNPAPPPPSSPRRKRGFRGAFTPRTIAAPVAAFTMAVLLYTYAVTAIGAAKRNAALHRAADGGQLDMRRESLRRHGALERVEGTGGVELFRASGGVGGGVERKGERRTAEAGREVEGAEGKGKGKGGSKVEKPPMQGRTEVEGALEGWKGREGAERLRSGLPPSMGRGERRVLEEGVGRGT